MLKKLFKILGVCLVIFLVYHYEALFYGIQQGAGQVKVLWNAEEISDLIENPNFPDSTKQKFEYIAKVKAFAEKKIGLTKTDNYTTFYDQKGKPILWVVTASPEFEIEAYEWEFPIAGGFPYKGFWDLEKAKNEAVQMKNKGFDVEVDDVSAWSTLGFFRDPILSNMLLREPGSLAELIIHESLHATLYVKDSVEFNENLASFIGRKGALLFLKEHFGENSLEVKEYENILLSKSLFKNYMRYEIDELTEKYNSLEFSSTLEVKRMKKEKWINEIKEGIFRLNYDRDSLELRARLDTIPFNNAYFSGFKTYSEDLPKLELQFKEEFNSDLKLMVTTFKNKFESL